VIQQPVAAGRVQLLADVLEQRPLVFARLGGRQSEAARVSVLARYATEGRLAR
jgi:hypothetical protein